MDTLGLANSSVTLVVVQKLDNNLVSAGNKTNLWLPCDCTGFFSHSGTNCNMLLLSMNIT